MVPFIDLKEQYKGVAQAVEKKLKEILESQRFVLDKNVEALEREIASLCGVKYGIGVASGSDALLLSLMAIGVDYGDSVVTTPYTFFATAGSIARLGARPLFVDIEPRTYNMDPERLEDCIKKGGRVKAIIPVHLFGQCAEMDPILEVGKRYDLKVIEDAAQAIGASYKGKMAGGMGDTGCFSFFPTKNLGGFGDGGMVVTNDKDLAAKIRALRVHGSLKRYYHTYIGCNSRLDEIQAAVLLVKLEHLPGWAEERRKKADNYRRLFRSAGLEGLVRLPEEGPFRRHVYNQFVIRVPLRDALRRYLEERGIGTEVYYPIPLHLQECFRYLGYREGDFPEAERLSKESLALPIYPELKEEAQEFVVESIRSFYRR